MLNQVQHDAEVLRRYRDAMHHPLRLTVGKAALQHNWRWLENRAGVPAGAAIKADGYGLGATETLQALYEAGCREFFVATWAEAAELGMVPGDVGIIVLHGIGPADTEAALNSSARPVLNSIEQVA
jgi:alanine racemase